MNSSFIEELIKIAQEDPSFSRTEKGLLGALLGGASFVGANSAHQDALGFKNLYHGTQTPEAAQSIKDKGLLSRYGGTGASAREDVLDSYAKASKNKIHVTPISLDARQYAALGNNFNEPLPDSVSKKRMISMSVPDSIASKLKPDPDTAKGLIGEGIDIPSKYVKGSKDYRRSALYAERLRNLPSYIRTNPGKFLKGVGGLSASVAAGGIGAKLIADALSEKTGNEQFMTVTDAKKQAPKHGLEGRLTRGAAPGAGFKTTQGPRAYAPRISKPV